MVRAKVRLEFPEKLFYEKLLLDWKENITDRNHGYVIRKALENIKRFPLAINGYNELRKIKGIGEHIATHLDAAWRRACETHFFTVTPTVTQVRVLKRGEIMPFLEQAFVSKGRRDVIPFLQRNNSGGPSSSQVAVEHQSRNDDFITSSSKTVSQPLPRFASSDAERDAGFNDVMKDVQEDSFNQSFSQPTCSNVEKENTSSFRTAISQTTTLKTTSNSTNTHSNSTITMISSNGIGVVSQSTTQPTQNTGGESSGIMLSYDPSTFAGCKLMLIVDGREQNCVKGGGNRNRTSITHHLDKLDVPFEVRTLAVGDYLWTLRMENGVDEMVLDYIVERKTWDDLRVSIRQTRYSEQKKRLRESGIRNVLLLVEGQSTNDRGLEQALASTSVDNHFLVHRTLSIQGTAKFLKTLTDRLSKRLAHEHMCGPSFETLQNESRKMKVFSVHDCWIRQLTVCPLMSTEKAKLIANHFPTLRTLTNFYKRKVDEAKESGGILNFPTLLHDEITDVPKSLSAQLALFFESYCCQ